MECWAGTKLSLSLFPLGVCIGWQCRSSEETGGQSQEAHSQDFDSCNAGHWGTDYIYCRGLGIGVCKVGSIGCFCLWLDINMLYIL